MKIEDAIEKGRQMAGDFSGELTDDQKERVKRHLLIAATTDVDRETDRLIDRLHQIQRRRRWNYVSLFVASVAAVAVIFYAVRMPSSPPDELPILPIGSKAILVIGDRSEISLDNEVQLGELLKREETRQALHKIIIPRGSEFTFRLTDGTKVYLNSESSLEFPVEFTKHERRLTLTGEAYFQVEKDSLRPFIVVSGEVGIRVVGTSFNVCNRRDEQVMNVVLVDGVLEVAVEDNIRILKPSDQFEHNRATGEMAVVQVDTRRATAWKDGFIAFENESLESIARRISRWYDIDISYNEQVSQYKFSGSIPKYRDVREVLDVLVLPGDVTYSVDKDKSVYITIANQ